MNLTRRQAIKALASTIAVSAVPAIATTDEKTSSSEFLEKIHRAVSHLEDLFGKRYDASADVICIITHSIKDEPVVEVIKKTYGNRSLMESTRLEKGKVLVCMLNKPTDDYHWVSYDFVTDAWHDSTGKTLCLD